jgi:hypothetical protein
MQPPKTKYHKGTRLPKAGIDAHGRQIMNELLYRDTSQLVGIPEAMVEEIILYVGKFTAAAIESNLFIDIMIPQFGKFRVDNRKLVKRERYKIHFSTQRFISSTTKKILEDMEREGLAKRIGKIWMSTSSTQPIVFPTYLTDVRAIELYKAEVLTREYILRIFASKPEALENLNREMDQADYYKQLKTQNAETI